MANVSSDMKTITSAVIGLAIAGLSFAQAPAAAPAGNDATTAAHTKKPKKAKKEKHTAASTTTTPATPAAPAAK